MFWTVAAIALNPYSIMLYTGVMLVLGVLKLNSRLPLYFSYACIVFALMVAAAFVGSYDSYRQAQAHGAPDLLVLLSSLPLIAFGLGLLLRRIVRR